jgi:hypothetical protein
MTRIESGPARTDALYHLGTLLFFIGFGTWFLYDWKIGYPESNRARAIEQLHHFIEDKSLQDADKAATLYDGLGDSPTEEQFNRLLEQFAKSGAPLDTSAIREKFGEPSLTREMDDGRKLEFWLSKTGGLKAELKDGRLQPILANKNWRKWYKSHDEVEAQKWFGLVPFVLALYFVYKLVKALTLRASLDDNEFVYGGARIPVSQIESIRDYNPKGWIDVWYLNASNDRRKVRLDNQKIEKFNELVEALCALKGVPNPIAAHQAQREADGPTA